MRFLNVRQTGERWPVTAPELHPVETAQILHVPLATRPIISPNSPATPSKPLGASVTTGEILCPPGHGGSPAVVAPASGRLVRFTTVTLLNGCHVPAIELEVAGPGAAQPSTAQQADSKNPAGTTTSDTDPCRYDLRPWIDRIRQAGIWADRRSSPDLLGQLYQAVSSPVDTVVCNLLDDETTMRLSSTLASHYGPMLLAGVQLLARLVEAKKIVIAVETSAPARWLSRLRKLTRGSAIEFTPLINDYPLSDPTILLYALLRRRLKPGLSPVTQQALMLDAATAVAIGQAVTSGLPMIRVPFAIRDHINHRSHLLMVPVGTTLREVMHEIDAPTDDVTIRRGDVLHENDVTLDAVIAGGDLTVHVLPRQAAPLSDPCIRCSWCVESCPTHVQPAGLLEAAQLGNMAMARHFGIDACIECGVCSYVCPSHLPLLAGIRSLQQLKVRCDTSKG